MSDPATPEAPTSTTVWWPRMIWGLAAVTAVAVLILENPTVETGPSTAGGEPSAAGGSSTPAGAGTTTTLGELSVGTKLEDGWQVTSLLREGPIVRIQLTREGVTRGYALALGDALERSPLSFGEVAVTYQGSGPLEDYRPAFEILKAALTRGAPPGDGIRALDSP